MAAILRILGIGVLVVVLLFLTMAACGVHEIGKLFHDDPPATVTVTAPPPAR
ncbi:hypothetical protein [Amycolatopsis sp. DSM 110486]|uniref:hypothetical protein n=1 Tax=Amycolatopsis sp. DSM 110486 TaxID=2865832 RepID=UPI001C698653|nr:hypothetical protein [Amycolatopsis sp. DSM 110486]QYN17553.1 hypothetical protein K1T34_32730 [Amycolatopsis sp. DSM 110486]